HHRGRHHFGIFGDRQAPQSHEAGHENQERQYRRENRPVDEKARYVHGFLPPAAGCAACAFAATLGSSIGTTCGMTAAPGRSPMRTPLTMIFSPAFRPEATMRRLSDEGP